MKATPSVRCPEEEEEDLAAPPPPGRMKGIRTAASKAASNSGLRASSRRRAREVLKNEWQY